MNIEERKKIINHLNEQEKCKKPDSWKVGILKPLSKSERKSSKQCLELYFLKKHLDNVGILLIDKDGEIENLSFASNIAEEKLKSGVKIYVDWAYGTDAIKNPHSKTFDKFFNKLENHDYPSETVAFLKQKGYTFKLSKEYTGDINMENNEKQRTITIKQLSNKIPLNCILYGPPGTGKTYNTINSALQIVDNVYYKENADNRSALKIKFDEYVKSGRIGFVTFHQSFSYEDFVEGLRAEADDNDNIRYFVQDGIFKQLCDKAIQSDDSSSIDESIQKLIEKLEEEPIHLETSTGKEFTVTYRGGRTFRIKPDSSDKTSDYPASIENIKKIFRGASPKDIYNRSYVLSILQHLKSEYGLNDKKVTNIKKGPVVLIIDEINRGNTANIFGELITLIEPSKRSGADEALSVNLPYSKEKFSVPDNLYIIGTMNTADRSLALIDTALRRRFQFQEMFPDPELISGITVEGVDIQKMMTTINKRIALLYDREHTIGHSFFMSLNNQSTIRDLQSIFNRQILPLLEEYFFEDWEKIRQVLGDTNKPDELQIITTEIDETEVVHLLGNEYNNNIINSLYSRNEVALSKPEAYISIYQR